MPHNNLIRRRRITNHQSKSLESKNLESKQLQNVEPITEKRGQLFKSKDDEYQQPNQGLASKTYKQVCSQQVHNQVDTYSSLREINDSEFGNISDSEHYDKIEGGSAKPESISNDSQIDDCCAKIEILYHESQIDYYSTCIERIYNTIKQDNSLQQTHNQVDAHPFRTQHRDGIDDVCYGETNNHYNHIDPYNSTCS